MSEHFVVGQETPPIQHGRSCSSFAPSSASCTPRSAGAPPSEGNRRDVMAARQSMLKKSASLFDRPLEISPSLRQAQGFTKEFSDGPLLCKRASLRDRSSDAFHLLKSERRSSSKDTVGSGGSRHRGPENIERHRSAENIDTTPRTRRVTDTWTKVSRPRRVSQVLEQLDRENALAQRTSISKHTPNLDYVFVFPLPANVTQDEEARFRSFLGNRSYRALLDSLLLNPQSREHAEFDCGEPTESLAGLKNCVIELMTDIFRSIAISHHGNVEMFTFTSIERDVYFACLAFDEETAETIATLQDYPLQLNERALQLLDIQITDQADLEPAYVRYTSSMRDKGLLQVKTQPGELSNTSVLRQVDRVRLTYDRITDHIDINELELLGLICHHYPAHNPAVLEVLRRNWANMNLMFRFFQPIDEVRDYFGEEIAFYFLFMESMNIGLATLLGPVTIYFCFCAMYGETDQNKACFTVVVMSWFTITIKLFRRRQAYFANKWGVDHSSAQLFVQDPVNPACKGKVCVSPLDENQSTLRPDTLTMVIGRILSVGGCAIWIVLVFSIILLNRMWVIHVGEAARERMFHVFLTVLLPLQIQVFDVIWDAVGGKLTDFEAHVHLRSHYNSKAVKTFIMKFIHWFAVLIVIAYVQPLVYERDIKDNVSILSETLIIMFVVYSGLAVADCAKPYFRMRYRVWKQSEESRRQHDTENCRVSFLEQQAKMDVYTGDDRTTDFIQVVFPLAWVATFATIMPSAALMAYLNLTMQLRVDSWRLVALYRRPFPLRVEGIGVWDDILEVINYLSITNLLGMLIMHVESIANICPFAHMDASELTQAHRLVAFFMMQNVAIFCKVVFNKCVPDIGPKTKLNQSRQELQRTRLFEFSKAAYDEDVDLIGRGDIHTAAFDQRPGLCPGNPRFYDPPSQFACGCSFGCAFPRLRRHSSEGREIQHSS